MINIERVVDEELKRQHDYRADGIEHAVRRVRMIRGAELMLELRPETSEDELKRAGVDLYWLAKHADNEYRAECIHAWSLAQRFMRGVSGLRGLHIDELRTWYQLSKVHDTDRVSRLADVFARRSMQIPNDTKVALATADMDTDAVVDMCEKLAHVVGGWRGMPQTVFHVLGTDLDRMLVASKVLSPWTQRVRSVPAIRLLERVPLDRVEDVTALLDSDVDRDVLREVIKRDGFDVLAVLDMWMFCVEQDYPLGFFEASIIAWNEEVSA